MGMLWKVLAAAAVAAAASLDGLRAPREVHRSAATPRYVLYLDQYHTASFPSKDAMSGINYVITAFANSSLFTTSPPGNYTPFMPLAKVRSMFDDDTKVCMAIGGWADNAGFDLAARNDTTRKLFSKNIATTLDRLGYDCVDIDWEYPAGNGADYRQIPNSKKAYEIEAYPKLLKDIKKAIGCKELSIAVPGLERDMIAYTHTKVPKINEAVDFVNVMTYDLMNRRDNATRHHTSVAGSLQAIDLYIQRGFPPSKLNLGFAFYAKYFTTAANVTCNQPVGCPTALLEAADGSDTGLSGAMTFEAINFAEPPTNLTLSPDGSCGPGTFHMCGEGLCCSQYGFCGNTPAHCNAGCNVGYGRCDGVSTAQSFRTAMKNGKTDDVQGGQWYWDAAAKLFWTWDTPELMARKFNDIVKTRGLGGVMAWSLAEDSFGNWPHLAAMKQGVEKMKGGY